MRDLFVDLTSCIDSEFTDDLFLGSMIFDVSKEKSEGTLEVIDGQQRLTTIVLALIAARNYARSVIGNEKLAHSIHKYVSNIDELSDEAHHRLIASPRVGDVFDVICDYDWDGEFPSTIKKSSKTIWLKRQSSKLKPIYNFCMSEIADYCGGDEAKFRGLLKQIVNQSFIIRIDIEDKAEAFEIFERTNARGKGLEVSDLLKNFLFSKDKELADEAISDVWDDITEAFGSNLLRALKYFWISRKGAVTSRDLYRRLRYYAAEIGIPAFVEELKEFADFYSAYHTDDHLLQKDWLIECGFPANDMYLNEFRRTTSILRLFRVTQVVPFIFALMKSYQRGEPSEKSAKQVLTVLRTIESFHFVNNKVCNRIGNETEKAYTEFSVELYHSKGFGGLNDIRQWFDKSIASFEEFEGSLSAISYENKSDRMTIRYVFDKIVNDGVKDGQRQDLVDISAYERGIKPSFDIEHLMNQSDATTDEASEYVHQIGNLLVIPKQINGILSNAPFAAKMDMLKHPYKYDNNVKNVPSYLQAFVEEYGQAGWGEDEINSRTKDVAKEVYEFSRFKSAYK